MDNIVVSWRTGSKSGPNGEADRGWSSVLIKEIVQQIVPNRRFTKKWGKLQSQEKRRKGSHSR
jgi:hypothetical protein